MIEDDPAAAAFLSEVIAEDGFEVELAVTGEDGIERANERLPALVCLDVTLAGELDGWQVLSQLKANRATASVLIVMCTAGNNRDRAAGLWVRTS